MGDGSQVEVNGTPYIRLTESEKAVMNIVRLHQPIARSSVTKHSSFTQQAVHRLIGVLLEKELLREEKAVIRGRGKPSPQLVLNDQATFSMGVSIQSDHVETVALSLSGKLIEKLVLKSAPNDREGVLNELKEIAENWKKNDGKPLRRLIGVGVSIQGYRSKNSSYFTTPVPTENWSRLPVDNVVESALGVPVFVENNANCAAIAEVHKSKDSGQSSIVCLTFNFGFGAGVIWNGQIVAGSFGNAGEVGRLFSKDEMPHRPALGEFVKRLATKGIKVADLADLQARFDPNWDGVHEWVEEVAPYLNRTIYAARAIVDPEIIYFGGEAPSALRQLLIEACEFESENRFGEKQPFPKLLCSGFDGDSTAFGAATLPTRQLVF